VNGDVPLAGGIPGGFPTVLNTRSIRMFGLSGDDTIRLDETDGPLPASQMIGGSGQDALHRQGATTSSAAGPARTPRAAADDELIVNALGGNDRVVARSVPAGAITFTVDGGAGDHDLVGTDGDDVLRGEEGDDLLDGGAGDDILIGGAGDDILLNGEVELDE
jgi:Ca2+-binding RTX toxin-like protein